MRFETPLIRLSYKVYRQFLHTKSRLVTLVIRDWNAIILHLRDFNNFMREEKIAKGSSLSFSGP